MAAIRTRASGFRASGNWKRYSFSQEPLPNAGYTVVQPTDPQGFTLVGFRISAVFSQAAPTISPAIVSFRETLGGYSSLLAPIFTVEAAPYAGLSFLESGDFGDGLKLGPGWGLEIKTDVAFSGGTLKMAGVIYGRIE
jgi:hypothetical protein